jgi:hypothetical protein
LRQLDNGYAFFEPTVDQIARTQKATQGCTGNDSSHR